MTTPPVVCTASCWTTPATGATRVCRRTRRRAFASSSTRVSTRRSASAAPRSGRACTRLDRGPLLAAAGNRRFQLARPGLVDLQILSLRDPLLLKRQVLGGRAHLPVGQRLECVDPPVSSGRVRSSLVTVSRAAWWAASRSTSASSRLARRARSSANWPSRIRRWTAESATGSPRTSGGGGRGDRIAARARLHGGRSRSIGRINRLSRTSPPLSAPSGTGYRQPAAVDSHSRPAAPPWPRLTPALLTVAGHLSRQPAQGPCPPRSLACILA